ncbi:Hypothetical predicted protein [Olea europaea subsp. europaea]|uniref:Uncharacterized protein n=1 Tax=Olea europaea subsp. europaea TaxID=158383 RepID=A0A8S0SGE6_OLEEU|nr:Hypothetical predicted protein [Olea europaea subsp. europaea]
MSNRQRSRNRRPSGMYARLRELERRDNADYRPGRSRHIVDDFAVMPMIPDSAFRDYTRTNPPRQTRDEHPPFYSPDEPLSEAQIQDRAQDQAEAENADVIVIDTDEEDPLREYELYDFELPTLDRPRTPDEGCDGHSVGMERCSYCKSWLKPANLTEGKCQDCTKSKNDENQQPVLTTNEQ